MNGQQAKTDRTLNLIFIRQLFEKGSFIYFQQKWVSGSLTLIAIRVDFLEGSNKQGLLFVLDYNKEIWAVSVMSMR